MVEHVFIWSTLQFEKELGQIIAMTPFLMNLTFFRVSKYIFNNDINLLVFSVCTENYPLIFPYKNIF